MKLKVYIAGDDAYDFLTSRLSERNYEFIKVPDDGVYVSKYVARYDLRVLWMLESTIREWWRVFKKKEGKA